MVGLELVELYFEVRRRQDVGQDHGVEVHGLLVAPEREHIALLARDRRLGSAAAAALLLLLSRSSGRLVLRLRVACQRGAVVSHVAAEGRREGRKEGGGGGQARSRSSGQRSGTLLHGTSSGEGAALLCPSRAREGTQGADKRTPGREQTAKPSPRELHAEGEPAARELDLFRQLPLGTRWRTRRI